MNYTYAKGWFRAHKRPLALWSEEQARTKHNAGGVYTVLVGDNPENFEAFIEINAVSGFIGVNFLDEYLRPYLEYKFFKKDNRYFLQQTLQRFYKDNEDFVVGSEIYNFTPQGKVTIYQENVELKETIVKQATKDIDVSKNWEDKLVFGQYEGFLRKER